jgi:hypothetical protein
MSKLPELAEVLRECGIDVGGRRSWPTGKDDVPDGEPPLCFRKVRSGPLGELSLLLVRDTAENAGAERTGPSCDVSLMGLAVVEHGHAELAVKLRGVLSCEVLFDTRDAVEIESETTPVFSWIKLPEGTGQGEGSFSLRGAGGPSFLWRLPFPSVFLLRVCVAVRLLTAFLRP